MRIRAKGPPRTSFAGGGTDVPPSPEQGSGLVLNAAINTLVAHILGDLVELEFG